MLVFYWKAACAVTMHCCIFTRKHDQIHTAISCKCFCLHNEYYLKYITDWFLFILNLRVSKKYIYSNKYLYNVTENNAYCTFSWK